MEQSVLAQRTTPWVRVIIRRFLMATSLLVAPIGPTASWVAQARTWLFLDMVMQLAWKASMVEMWVIMTVSWMLLGRIAAAPAVSSSPTPKASAPRAASTFTTDTRMVMARHWSQKWSTKCAMKVAGSMEVFHAEAKPSISQVMLRLWVQPWVLEGFMVLVYQSGPKHVVEEEQSCWSPTIAVSSTALPSSHQSIDELWKKGQCLQNSDIRMLRKMEYFTCSHIVADMNHTSIT